jgi:hypothetical protein
MESKTIGAVLSIGVSEFTELPLFRQEGKEKAENAIRMAAIPGIWSERIIKTGFG